jgi:hypothetical protein
MQTQQTPNTSDCPINRFLKEHEHLVNLEYPDLNTESMLFFKDNNVTIGKEVFTVITIYQPLYDPNDYKDIKLSLDPSNPTILRKISPNITSFLRNAVDGVHEQEEDTENPEVFSFPRKQHKTMATAINSDERRKLKMTMFRLPFSLKLDHFGNTASQLVKNYRNVEVPVTATIHHTCAFIYWKVVVDEEARRLEPDAKAEDDPFAEAQKRMSKMKVDDSS